MKYQVIKTIDQDDKNSVVETKDSLKEAEVLADQLATKDTEYRLKNKGYYPVPVYWIRHIGSNKT